MDFDRAYATLIDPQHEGGFSDDPKDPGGPTYKGIARNFHPQWSGWSLVDAHKAVANFPASLEADAMLQDSVKAFYFTEFWTRVGCDAVPEALRFDLFDMAVNCGQVPAAKALQHAAGVAEDGVIGPGTRAAIASTDPARLLFRFDAARLIHYTETPDAQWLRFGRGWVRRVATNMQAVEV